MSDVDPMFDHDPKPRTPAVDPFVGWLLVCMVLGLIVVACRRLFS